MSKDPSIENLARDLIQREIIIWLTTTSRDLNPQPRPVWFIWHLDQFLIYSRPTSHKLRHIQERPNVSLNFNTDREADNDIVVFNGIARISPEIAAANELPAYAEKYAEGIKGIGMTAEEFGRSYSVPILIAVEKTRGMA